jgi:HEAT repeat protein
MTAEDILNNCIFALERDQSWRKREQAAHQLEILAHDPMMQGDNVLQRRTAIWLVSTIRNDTVRSVRRAASSALTQYRQVGLDILLGALEHEWDWEEAEQRSALEEAFIEFGALAAEPLYQVLHQHPDSSMRFSAVLILSYLDHPKRQVALQEACNDQDPFVRHAATSILADVQDLPPRLPLLALSRRIRSSRRYSDEGN